MTIYTDNQDQDAEQAQERFRKVGVDLRLDAFKIPFVHAILSHGHVVGDSKQQQDDRYLVRSVR